MRSFVQQLLPIVLVALVSALIVVGAYHVLVAGPRIARLSTALEAHDALLGGSGAKATDRIVTLESAATDSARAHTDALRRLVALEAVATNEVPRVGFVRYNAFADTGSDLSFALALLSKRGDGVVVSSIWSREETRTYGKAVTNFSSAQDASKEELDAIARARAAAS
jgi:Protein of unknown function (DUF4446)